MDTFINKVKAISTFSTTDFSAFIACWQQMQVTKETILLEENAVNNQLYFINKGIVRIYYLKNGKEVTEWIAMDETFFFSITSFFKRTPSKLIIHTIESAEIMYLQYDKLMELCDKYHSVERWFRKLLTSSLILSQKRMESIQFESAQQRYENLMQSNASIIQRVPLSYIASFLGITQETLSRIRGHR